MYLQDELDPMEQLLPRPNLRDQIYDVLKKLIIFREIKPGQKINEENLAKRLQVSRTPIRETLLRLELEGIVKNVPRRGAYVVTQSKKKIIDILQVREVLEGLVARLAAENITDKGLERLRNCLRKIESAKDEEDRLLKYNAAEKEFHCLLLEACKNDVLKAMMETVNVHLEVLRLRTVVLAGRAQQSVREHMEIVEAVGKGDAAGAEELMRRHVKSVQRDALRHIDLMV